MSASRFLEGISAAASHNPNFSTAIFDGIRSKFSELRWRFQITVELLYQLLRDLPRTSAGYAGPGIQAVAFELASGTRFRVHATGTLGPAPSIEKPT